MVGASLAAEWWYRPRPSPCIALTPRLTCRMLLVSGTANSSFSFGVFTVTLMIRGSDAEADAAGTGGSVGLWGPGGFSPLSDMARAGRVDERRGGLLCSLAKPRSECWVRSTLSSLLNASRARAPHHYKALPLSESSTETARLNGGAY